MRTNKVFSLLNEMATLVKVVETGSFSEAARQFGSTPSAVSRSIAKLEKALNTQLIQRTTRKLRLSDSGQEVFRHAQAMMQSMQLAVSSAGKSDDELAGKIKIAAPRALGRFLIHPLLPDFLAQHPKVDIVFILEDRFVDLIDEDIDIVFRITDEPPPGMMGRKLMRIEHLICATPSYLEENTTPEHPHDLKKHSCIALSEQSIDARWKFTKEDKNVYVDVGGRYTANHTGVRLDAVLNDLGIASLPAFIAEPALLTGKIVQVLSDWIFTTNYHGDVWMFYPPTKHLPLRLRAFIAYLAEKLKSR